MVDKTSEKEVVFHELGFAEFVELVKPSASVNRLPQLPGIDDVLTYQVFMDGDIAKHLDPSVTEQQISGELLHEATKRLGLNPEAFRDNMLVAEMVSLRSAWRYSVLMSSRGNGWEEAPTIPQNVMDDFERLTEKNFAQHPWVVARLEAHRGGIENLQAALKIAENITGHPVVDLAPEGVNHGLIVMQNRHYTAQAVGKGDENTVIMHENKRLNGLPRVGDEVTIVVYRGQGQVFTRSPELQLSDPYLHSTHDALAINVVDTLRNKTQVVVFSGVADFAKFAKAHDLDPILVAQGIEALQPKLDRLREKPNREVIGEPFVDKTTGAFAISYVERGTLHTALFDSKERLRTSAQDFGISADDVRLRNLDALQQPVAGISGPNAMVAMARESNEQIRNQVAAMGDEFRECIEPNVTNGRYSGPVVAETVLHVAQDGGRGQAVIHAKLDLDKVPEKGKMLSVQYKDNRGVVSQRNVSQGHTR